MASVQQPFANLYFEFPFGDGSLATPYIGGLFFKNGTASAIATIDSGTPANNQGIPFTQLAGSGLAPAAFGSGVNGSTVQRFTMATDDALYNRIGEVQAVPTTNTLLGRLADINNTLNGSGIASTTLTIANAASLSNGINLAGKALLHFYMPAAWTTASMTFQFSTDNVTWRNVYYQTGSEYVISVAADRVIVLNPSDFAAIQWIRFRSGTSVSPINQGAERIITAVHRAL